MVGGLVAGGPVDGGPLHEAKPETVARDDGGGARGHAVHPRSGALDAESVELLERGPDRLLAVVHVVGDTDRVIPADDEGLSGCEGGIEALALHRVPGGWLIEAALKIAEQHVGPP